MRAKPDWELWKQKIVFCGVDEVGRGALAGPVVAAAVVLPPFVKIPGVKDSKQLTPEKREKLFPIITNKALAYSFGFASVKEIDCLNIKNASFLAMNRAIKALAVKCDLALVDGFVIPNCPLPNIGIIKGDQKSLSIACASILAKVTRDHIMEKFHKQYPKYNFPIHKGYPTRHHKLMLLQYGPSRIHRKSFKPVVQCLKH
ncbi:MAG: ribonuclease HII [candidate division WOR-3 bacterium]|nr:ribonuclease HII [candidate division WOR-3 bacterium]